MTAVFKKMFNEFLKNNFDYQNIAYNDLFYYFIKNSFDIFIIRDINLKTIWLNRVPYTLTDHNITEVDIRNNPCYRVLFQNSEPCINCPVFKSKKTGKPAESEIKTPDGHVFMVRSYPMRNRSKKIVGFFEVILNITRKKRLKNKLIIEKSKIDFFTNLSHEFKTPINMMHATLQLLEKKLDNVDSKNRESFARHFKVLKQNNLRLYKMISNILDINKIDKGYYKHYPRNCDIVKILKNTVLSCSDYVGKQNKKLQFTSKINSKIMACDPFDIERIILNLLSNSLKFTGPGDSISVTIKDNNKEIIVLVRDTGIGIAKEYQNKIFEKFNQVQNSMTRGSEGSGLGMYIVKSLIEMHEGTISLTSEPGKGTEFLIKLPIRVLSCSNKPDSTIYQNIDYNMIDRTDIELSDIN